MTNEELTKIYNEANLLDLTRHNSVTTERIFAAMRAAMAIGAELANARTMEIMEWQRTGYNSAQTDYILGELKCGMLRLPKH